MTKRIRGQSDESVAQILDALDEYERQHPAAAIELYRYNGGSVRVRIIDPSFDGIDPVDRDNRLWKLLDAKLPEDVVSDISFLILLTPEETATSLANLEFEHPSPSLL